MSKLKKKKEGRAPRCPGGPLATVDRWKRLCSCTTATECQRPGTSGGAPAVSSGGRAAGGCPPPDSRQAPAATDPPTQPCPKLSRKPLKKYFWLQLQHGYGRPDQSMASRRGSIGSNPPPNLGGGITTCHIVPADLPRWNALGMHSCNCGQMVWKAYALAMHFATKNIWKYLEKCIWNSV